MTLDELGHRLANDERFMSGVMRAHEIAKRALEAVECKKEEVTENATATYSPNAQPGASNSHAARSARKAA